jgi:hypothetical protein
MTEDDRSQESPLAEYKKDVALGEYKEVAAQFRALTDIRFRLLTYLPLGTVAAAVFAQKTSDLVQPAISAFAFAVTLSLAIYNKRNDQFYDELVLRAAELERDLQIEHGSFSDRPRPMLKYGLVTSFSDRRSSFLKYGLAVEHRWPIGFIYAATASLWAYLFTAALYPASRWPQVAVPAAVIACWQGLRWMERKHNEKQKEIVKGLIGTLLGSNDEESLLTLAQRIAAEPILDKIVKTIITEQPILGIETAKVMRRAAYHWVEYDRKHDRRAASILLSKVIDLPARWIEDVWSGRR